MMQENTVLSAVLNLEAAAAQAQNVDMMALVSYIKETAIDFCLKFGPQSIPKAVREDMLAQSRAVLKEIAQDPMPHALPRRLRRIYFSLFETAADEAFGGNPEAVRRVLVRSRDSLRAAQEGQAHFESILRYAADEVQAAEREAYAGHLSQLAQAFDNLLLLYRSSCHAQHIARSGYLARSGEETLPTAHELRYENESIRLMQEKWQENLEKILVSAEMC